MVLMSSQVLWVTQLASARIQHPEGLSSMPQLPLAVLPFFIGHLGIQGVQEAIPAAAAAADGIRLACVG